MYHINHDNKMGKCRAKKEENCRFYTGGKEVNHYETLEEATSALEDKLSENTNVYATKSKKVKYSFLSDFKELEDKFDEIHDGVPNRFYNADLIGKGTIQVYGPYNLENAPYENVLVNQSKLIARLAQATSTPKDNQMSTEDAEKLFDKMGLQNVSQITNDRVLRNFKADRVWVAHQDIGEGKTQQVIISDNKHGQPFAPYRFRSRALLDDKITSTAFTNIDLRSIAGADRMERMTNVKVFNDSLKHNRSWHSTPKEYQAKVVASLILLSKDQEESRDFKERQKYIKDANSKVATVWNNKKNAKDTHIEAAQKSPLKKDFAEVEIDNDVDLVEFKQFSDDYEEVRSKLPKIPEDRKPRIAIRKLGKHSSANFTVSGLYSPGHNAIAISVEDSGSTIHEMAHMYDFNLKNNASMQQEFKSIKNDYSSTIKLPPSATGKEEYYTSSHEVFARGFEVYANQKLGVNNRLLNTEKFDNFDYEPIDKNPQLKEKIFNFYDKLFKE